MTQSEIDQAVAAKTGESVRTIRRHGFSIVSPLAIFDPEDGVNAEPQVLDWDRVEAERLSRAA
jgi:hypothetical protein